MDSDQRKLLHKKVELYRLILASDSIHSAQQAIEIALKESIDSDHTLFSIFHNAVVTCYARAFIEMKPFGKISSKWGKFENKTYLRVHDLLMEQRHKNVSHVDYLDSKVVLHPPGSLKNKGFDSNEILYVVKQELYHSQSYQMILEHMVELRKRMGVKVTALIDDIFREPDKLSSPVELITPKDIAYLSKRLNT